MSCTIRTWKQQGRHRPSRSSISSASPSDLPDVVHCETIASRSVLHDWVLAVHRHARLHQVLLIDSGGGQATLDGRIHGLRPMHIVNVPVGHVHGFSFEPGTQGWVLTIAAEVLDEALLAPEGLRGVLSQSAVRSRHPADPHHHEADICRVRGKEVRTCPRPARLVGGADRARRARTRKHGSRQRRGRSGAVPPLRGAGRGAPSGALERVGLCRGAVGDGNPSQPGDARRDRAIRPRI